jgi:hypothetical protein
MQNKPLKYILFLVLFVIVLDFGLGQVYEFLYFSEKSENQDRLVHSAIGTNEEVLIFGTSRAYHHYNSEVIEQILGLSCFNVGYGGQNIYHSLALLKAAIQRKKPQIAVLELMSIEGNEKNDLGKLSMLLPFVNKSNIYRDLILKRGISEHAKLLSSIYPFNSKQLYMLRNNLTTMRSDVKGFRGLTAEWDKPIEKRDVNVFSPDNSKMQEAIHEFIELCQKNEIKVFIFISPKYVNFLNKKNTYSEITEDIYKNYGLEVTSQINSPKYLSSPQFFSDPIHLNKIGADIYSREIALIIKNSM